MLLSCRNAHARHLQKQLGELDLVVQQIRGRIASDWRDLWCVWRWWRRWLRVPLRKTQLLPCIHELLPCTRSKLGIATPLIPHLLPGFLCRTLGLWIPELLDRGNSGEFVGLFACSIDEELLILEGLDLVLCTQCRQGRRDTDTRKLGHGMVLVVEQGADLIRIAGAGTVGIRRFVV